MAWAVLHATDGGQQERFLTSISPMASEPFTEAQKKQQEAFIAIISHPLILHSAFSDNVSFAGKLDEMISLRKGYWLHYVDTDISVNGPRNGPP
jgi:hypothetical protein